MYVGYMNVCVYVCMYVCMYVQKTSQGDFWLMSFTAGPETTSDIVHGVEVSRLDCE